MALFEQLRPREHNVSRSARTRSNFAHSKGALRMRIRFALGIIVLLAASSALAQNNIKNPTWWDKYNYLFHNGPDAAAGSTAPVSSGNAANVDASNECGPQSETNIT